MSHMSHTMSHIAYNIVYSVVLYRSAVVDCPVPLRRFRVEYLQKSKHLQEQLKEMRTEIEVLKIGENQTLYDHIHDEQVNLGENKYSTFKKVSSVDILPRM